MVNGQSAVEEPTTWVDPATPPDGVALPLLSPPIDMASPAVHLDANSWSDSSARAVLQLMTESVAEMVGFEVATVSVVLDDQLVTTTYIGPEELREAVFQRDPVTILEPVVRQAQAWGRFHFLAEEDQDGELEGNWVITSERDHDGPDAWRPSDVLIALLTDDAGALIGLLSVDKPTSGRRPDAATRRLLERYAAQTERAVVTAFEREALVRQVAHAETSRRLIRAASMPAHASLEAVLRSTHRPLVEGFGASGSWIQVFEANGGGLGYARTLEGDVIPLSNRLVQESRQLAPRLWERQRVLVIDHGAEAEAALPRMSSSALLTAATEEMAALSLTTALAVPLGVGSECLGFLVLTRRQENPPWSAVEIDSALQIGHDLGSALMTARALERERSLVRELQQLDDHRSQLISTLSHELRTPLTVISGNLEMLGELDLDDAGVRYQAAMARGTRRMQRVVDDLLLLAQVSDPRHPLVAVPVDLYDVIGDVIALVESTAQTKHLTIEVELTPDSLVVPGDLTELDRLIGNLVSNAVKYTPAGGTVSVRAHTEADAVVLQVGDTGIGISTEDQVGLFRAFFRSTNPDALREPGTGLGLAIVATIAERHHGSIDVTSHLHEGTTFTLTLPRTPAA